MGFLNFLGRMLGDEDERFYLLVINSLTKLTTGEEFNIKPFTFKDASRYAYMYVNTSYYEILDDDSIRIPYSYRGDKYNDKNIYKVTINKNDKGLALFNSVIDKE